MKRTLITVAILGALAVVPANAEELSAAAQAAKEQLAGKLGVDVDAYDYHTLVQLNCRLTGADTEGEKRRLLADIDNVGAQHRQSGDHAVQLAAELGVEASEYSLSQLVYLKGLIEGRNCSLSRAEQLAKTGERVSPEGATAKQQLAAVLGVEPQSYTLNELVKMKWEAEGND